MDDKPIEGELLPNLGGRKIEYNSSYPQRLIEVMRQGKKSIAQICAYLDIVPDTHYRWRNLYPEYNSAYLLGLNLSQAWWGDLIQDMAVGKTKGNVTAAIFAMCNYFPEEFKQRNSESTVNINVSKVEQLTDKQLNDKMQLLLENNKTEGT